MNLLFIITLIYTKDLTQRDKDTIIYNALANHEMNLKQLSEACVSDYMISVFLKYVKLVVQSVIDNNLENGEARKVLNERLGSLIELIEQCTLNNEADKLRTIWPRIWAYWGDLKENLKFLNLYGLKENEFRNILKLLYPNYKDYKIREDIEKEKSDDTKVKEKPGKDKGEKKYIEVKDILSHASSLSSIFEVVYKFIMPFYKKEAIKAEPPESLIQEIFEGNFQNVPKDLYLEDPFIDKVLNYKKQLTRTEHNNLVEFVKLVKENTKYDYKHMLNEKMPSDIIIADLKYINPYPLIIPTIKFIVENFDLICDEIEEFKNALQSNILCEDGDAK